jgi:hypothetical protein
VAIKVLSKNEKSRQVEQICKAYALEKSGMYRFFTNNGMVGYKLKNLRDNLMASSSFLTMMTRDKCIEWEKSRGLRTGD